MSRATQAAELYPYIRPRLWLPLPFTPHNSVTSPFSANASPFVAPIGRDATPRRLDCGVIVATTNNASNYWTITLNIITPGGAATAQGSIDTKTTGTTGWNVVSLSSFATTTWDAATYAICYLNITKTGTPGTLSLNPVLWVS